MITPVLMPQLGLEVTEGIVTALLVQIGDRVRHDQPLVELETDKAITEVLAPGDGVVRAIDCEPGQTVPVGAVLARLADSADEPLDSDAPRAPTRPLEPVSAPSGAGHPAPPAAPDRTRQRVAPVARRAAIDLGVDLALVTGTGPNGRVTLNDVRSAASNGQGPPVPRRPELAGRQELTATRRAIARRMTASQAIPQYHLIREIDASHLIAEKISQASRGPSKVGINDLLVQAMAETAVRHRALATSYVEGDDEQAPYLLVREAIDVGLAVATERGLVVAVIRGAQALGLGAIAQERRRLVDLARSGRIGLGEIKDATITLSSLAAAGIDHFAAMVNPGESTIVAVGRTVERLVPRGRTIAIVPTLTLTLTFDHRVVDGAVGAQALGEFAHLLEGGMTWRP